MQYYCSWSTHLPVTLWDKFTYIWWTTFSCKPFSCEQKYSEQKNNMRHGLPDTCTDWKTVIPAWREGGIAISHIFKFGHQFNKFQREVGKFVDASFQFQFKQRMSYYNVVRRYQYSIPIVETLHCNLVFDKLDNYSNFGISKQQIETTSQIWQVKVLY